MANVLYKKRVADLILERRLQGKGAILVEGPKWCGKTWDALNNANSVVYLDEEDTRRKVELSTELILNNDRPELIDEWNLIPKV